jgi:hypothetical protein
MRGVRADVAATTGIPGTEYEDGAGIGVLSATGVLYPSLSSESPETATFWNDGAPPPLRIMDSMSDRIVRIFTCAGGGGGALVKTLLKGFSI